MLKAAIATAASVVSKSIMPILSAVAIKSGNGRMEFTCTDLEVGIKTCVDYEAGEFSCCVDAKRLNDIIAVLDQPVFTLTDTLLTIKQGRMRFTLPYAPYDSHPGLPEYDNDGIELDSDIISLLHEVRYASAKNDTRYYLNGVYLHAENGRLSVIACNGHRIALRYKEFDQDFSLILPNKAVNLIIKHQPDMLIAGRMLHCLKNDFEMVCTPFDCAFPDIKKVLEARPETISIDKPELLLTLQALASLHEVEPTHAVKMLWKDDELLISGHGNDQSEVESLIPASFTAPNEIGINSLYLSDLVAAIDKSTECVCLEFTDAQSPLISRREHAIDLIMPLTI